MLTARWELEFDNCIGADFEFTFVQRGLIAGRTAWFLLGKLLWPENLTLIYPRWQIDTGVWWQYLFTIGETSFGNGQLTIVLLPPTSSTGQCTSSPGLPNLRAIPSP